MPTHKGPRTLEDLTEGFFRKQIKMAQNQRALITGEKTEADLLERAREEAEVQFRKNQERAGERAKAEQGLSLTQEEIDEYRQEREAAYEAAYDYNEANDYVSLMNLIELEVQMMVAKWDLKKPSLKPIDKQNHWEALGKMIEKHSKLQKDLGIDKKSRDAAKSNKSPLEKQEEEFAKADAWMAELLDKFPETADNITLEQGEAALRDEIKSSLGVGFPFIDAIIRNVKRLNGLDPTVATHD